MERRSVIPLAGSAVCGLLVGVALILVVSSTWDTARTVPPGDAMNRQRGHEPALLVGSEPLPAPDCPFGCPQSEITLCLRIYTGTVRSTFVISNPGGVSGFTEVDWANFDQRLLSQSATALEIEVTAQRFLDTHAPYPVDPGGLPGDILPYLLPQPGWIQSDHPLLVAQAQELVEGATRQAEAVDAIVAWVRGNIRYEGGHPSDAVSVYTYRSGVCAGFSTLTAALLRAAGIPAKYHSGCVSKWGDGWGWVVGDGGGWHAWNELYYSDVGWVALDPQVSTNYLDTGHILSGFDQCGQAGTIITRTEHVADGGFVYALRTPYTNSTWASLWVAAVPAWDRHPLRVSPPAFHIMLGVSDPIAHRTLHVENLGCTRQDWGVWARPAWLTPTVATGNVAGPASFAVDASGLVPGFYTGSLTVYGVSNPEWWSFVPSRDIAASLRLVDEVYRVYVPLASPGD